MSRIHCLLIRVLWQFLRLAALYPERRLHALPDVELLWKTHLIRPIHYRKVPSSFTRLTPHTRTSDSCVSCGWGVECRRRSSCLGVWWTTRK